MAKDTKDLVTASGFQIPEVSSNTNNAISEEMEGLPTTFDRIKIPSGGNIAFTLPGDNPDKPEITQEIEGVIVDHYPINAYWKDKYTGQKNFPDCSSLDSHTGEGNPGGSCKNCPLNKYGSGEDGKGKACKNMHRIYILRSGEMLPLLLTLPPTSIKAFGDYLSKRVLTKGLRSFGIITKISLKSTQNSTGITYSQAQFSRGEILNAELTKKLEDYSLNIKAVTRQVEIVDDSDYEEDTAPGVADEDLPF